MADPRKPVLSVTEGDATQLLGKVHDVLLEATSAGARKLGMTGVSFVLSGMTVWTVELADLDRRATARYLRALADTFDPTSNDNKRRRAEEARAKAARAIFAALDLEMAEPKGNG